MSAFLFSDPSIEGQFRQRWSASPGLAAWHVAYKAVISLFYWANLAYNWHCHGGTDNVWKYPIWLTSWAACSLGLALLLDTLATCLLALGRQVPARLLVASWVLSTAVYSLALLVTGLYWTLLFDYSEGPPSYSTLCVHLLQSVVVLLDQWITRRRWQLAHCWVAIPLPLLWTIFSIVYWAASGTGETGDPWIYPVLKWGSEPALAVGWSVLALLALTALHAFLWAVTRARDSLHARIWPDKGQFETIVMK
jgi:hypothetical protein